MQAEDPAFSACRVHLPSDAHCVKLKKSQIICHMEYLFTKGYVYFCAYFELESMFSRPGWHHKYGGKRHDDGPARLELQSLAFRSHNNPLRYRGYLLAVENI